MNIYSECEEGDERTEGGIWREERGRGKWERE